MNKSNNKKYFELCDYFICFLLNQKINYRRNFMMDFIGNLN